MRIQDRQTASSRMMHWTIGLVITLASLAVTSVHATTGISALEGLWMVIPIGIAVIIGVIVTMVYSVKALKAIREDSMKKPDKPKD